MTTDGEEQQSSRNGGKLKVARAVRVLVALVVLALLIVVTYVLIAPFGAKVVIRISPGKSSVRIRFYRPFTSSSELESNGAGGAYQIPGLKMTTDQVNFRLAVPYESFKTLRAKIRFKGDPEELSIGVLNPETNEFKSVPITNLSLNELGWPTVEGHGLTLYQRQEDYKTVDQFLKNLPAIVQQEIARENRSKVATYYYKPVQPTPAIDLSQAGAGAKISYTLRGTHTFYMYVGATPARLSFQKQDLNDYVNTDELVFDVYDPSDRLVYTRFFPDDGDATDDHKPSAVSRIDIALPTLSPGSYRVEFRCSDDVLVKNIVSSERYICAAEQVLLAENRYQDASAKPQTLYSDATTLTAEALNPEAVQSVVVNDSLNLAVAEPFNPVLVKLLPGVKVVKTEDGGLRLSAPGGFFAFAEGSLFDPFPVKTVGYFSGLNTTTFDYLIAGYVPPRERGGWLEQSVSLDIQDIRPKSKQYLISLSAPGLSKLNGEIAIDSVEITLSR